MSNPLVFPVPDDFRRGAFGGRKLVETGKQILDLVCETAGIEDFDGLKILDYGSGYRMAQVLQEYDMSYSSYCGIDIDDEMMGWLQANNPDERMTFHVVPFQNEMYLPDGHPMHADSELPVGDDKFDIIMMFSVVTHLAPEDSRALFSILRRYLTPDGFLYFSTFVNPLMEETYVEGKPDQPLWMSIYQEDFLFEILSDTGWACEHYSEPVDHLIQHQLLCRPTTDPNPRRPERQPGNAAYL